MSNKSSGQQVQYWYHRLEERCILVCGRVYSVKNCGTMPEGDIQNIG